MPPPPPPPPPPHRTRTSLLATFGGLVRPHSLCFHCHNWVPVTPPSLQTERYTKNANANNPRSQCTHGWTPEQLLDGMYVTIAHYHLDAGMISPLPLPQWRANGRSLFVQDMFRREEERERQRTGLAGLARIVEGLEEEEEDCGRKGKGAEEEEWTKHSGWAPLEDVPQDALARTWEAEVEKLRSRG